MTPLYENKHKNTEREELEVYAKNFCLLRLAESGNTQLINEALERGANPLAPDQRMPRPTFNLLLRNGESTLYTYDNLHNGTLPFRLIQSMRPAIAVYPYSNTYNLTAIDHAVRQCNLSTLELLRKTCEKYLPDDVLAKLHNDINLNALLKKLDKEQRKIQWAQTHAAIPTFPVLPHSDPTNTNVSITSEDDPELKIHAQIDKDTCIVETRSNPALWKTRYLDLDALSTLYAFLIIGNETEGARVLNFFDSWSKYNLFTVHVIRYVLDNLERESYDDRPFLPENLTQFAHRIAHYTNDIQQKVNPLQSEHLVGMTLCVCAAKSYNASGECKNPQWRDATDTLVKNLTSEPVTNQLCIKICDNNKPLFFVPAIKASMQKALLQRYCARILSRAEPHLDNALIERILSYWEPDDKFIDKIKHYKVDSKIGSIKKAFYAMIDKK